MGLRLSSRAKLPLTPDDPVGEIIDEVGDFDKGDGMRITLFPTHLYVACETPSARSFITVPIHDLLTALCALDGEES